MHCYVIASGPSLIGFNFDDLPGGFRIGANRSAWLAKCDALVTVDRNFHRKEPERIQSFGANAHVALPEEHGRLSGVTYWTYTRNMEGLALSPGALAGSNSGFAAFNLAVQLGYTEIALLGFDFRWYGNRSHFHEGYGQKLAVKRQLAQWARAFEDAARQTRERGIQVTNFVGPLGSLVKAFPTRPLDDLL